MNTIVAEIRRKEEAQTIFDNATDAGLTASLFEGSQAIRQVMMMMED